MWVERAHLAHRAVWQSHRALEQVRARRHPSERTRTLFHTLRWGPAAARSKQFDRELSAHVRLPTYIVYVLFPGLFSHVFSPTYAHASRLGGAAGGRVGAAVWCGEPCGGRIGAARAGTAAWQARSASVRNAGLEKGCSDCDQCSLMSTTSGCSRRAGRSYRSRDQAEIPYTTANRGVCLGLEGAWFCFQAETQRCIDT